MILPLSLLMSSFLTLVECLPFSLPSLSFDLSLLWLGEWVKNRNGDDSVSERVHCLFSSPFSLLLIEEETIKTGICLYEMDEMDVFSFSSLLVCACHSTGEREKHQQGVQLITIIIVIIFAMSEELSSRFTRGYGMHWSISTAKKTQEKITKQQEKRRKEITCWHYWVQLKGSAFIRGRDRLTRVTH